MDTRVLSRLLSAVLLLLVATPFDRLVDAIPGIYFTSDVLNNKWLPDPQDTIMITTRDDCENHCIKSRYCTGYAVSTFERKCRLYEVKQGLAPVKNNGYTLYIKKRTEEEGYYVYGTQYVRLMHERLNFYDARKRCQSENGDLVSIRKSDLNDLLLTLLLKFTVFEAFIGLTDDDVEGEWRYTDTGLASYTNWRWNGVWERTDRNCAVIVIEETGPWHHANCWSKYFFFCQIPMF